MHAGFNLFILQLSKLVSVMSRLVAIGMRSCYLQLFSNLIPLYSHNKVFQLYTIKLCKFANFQVEVHVYQ